MTAGERYGRWTVIGKRPASSRKVPCRCDCGTERAVFGPSLTGGESKSCGCLARELAAATMARVKLRHPLNPGDVYGRWTVLDPSDRKAVLCRCECGVQRPVQANNLVAGASRSCGCLKVEVTSQQFYKHGIGHDDYRYRLWSGMRQRCHNPTSQNYPNYGGRGISVHGPWHDFATFAADLDCLLGPRPPGHTLDRIDNDGNYEPGNIRWATYVEQANNRRSRWRNRE